ncbi:fasciclin-like arabinogalactan protein 14 [Manihot esculenta]|uniref:FAS1 domain-containing protein n=1 Tax=Manihot esculenta TaxID=3983 RepID=A0A2C9W1A8_MANES|nr:fasciclin-like arabinogalactan protein 14 [Manihot esculenta]OAY52629.1 hypothetical protein MANES_04G098500v8 [Manihot esculenta]
MPLVNFSSQFALFFSFFLLFFTVSAFNVTELLSDHSDFSNFNDKLSRTKLADTINHRKSITILAVDNGNLSPLDGLSSDAQKRVLSLHVILDYYDAAKLKKIAKKSATLTTLYQSTGQARGRQGFLNATDRGGGQVAFGSAVAGSNLNSNLVKSVTSKPYDISVLQVSSLIMPDSVVKSGSPAKAPSPLSDSPSPAPATSPSPPADSSASSPMTDGPDAADGPAADSPSGANGGTGTSLAMVATALSSAWVLAMMI